jgi:hypothetical protein
MSKNRASLNGQKGEVNTKRNTKGKNMKNYEDNNKRTLYKDEYKRAKRQNYEDNNKRTLYKDEYNRQKDKTTKTMTKIDKS